KTSEGKLVSANNKSGSSECSKAASELRTGKHSESTFTTLAECRAQALGHAKAHRQRAAGHEARAQHIEHMIKSNKPLGAKARKAKAAELKAGRNIKTTIARSGQSLD